MTPKREKLGRAVTFMKYFASIISLIFLQETLIWNKTTFPASNSLNLSGLVENELMRSISKKKKKKKFLLLSDLSPLNVKISGAYN